MRSTDSPFVIDWFAISLRWLFLLGVIVSLSLGGKLLALPNILLIALVCWNIALTLLTGLNRRLAFHREIGLGVDVLFAGAYFALAGGFASPVFRVVFLPLMTSALYFEMRGALISAVLMTAVQVAVAVYQTLAPVALIILGVSTLFTFVIAGVFGYLSVQLTQIIRRNLQTQQETRQKKLRVGNERLHTIYSLTSTLLAILNYQRVLESALDLSLSALNTDAEAAVDDRLICAVPLLSKDESLKLGRLVV